jgi:hypothetical protein
MELHKAPLEEMKLKLEILGMREDIKDKKMLAEVKAAAQMTDSESKRMKVEVADKDAETRKMVAKKPIAKKESK